MKKITVSDLTNEQKIKLIIGSNCWQNNNLDGLLPTVTMSDGPHGIRHPQNLEEACGDIVPSISYPALSVLANTWNYDLALKMGSALANDAIEKQIDIVLAPGVNIKRLPINGRNFEYFSEDPYLTGTMAEGYIKGLQDEHIGACLKHYLANNSEDGRHYKSMQIDELTLNEIYLKPFILALKANPWLLMCSYNLVNNIRMSENTEMFDLLRNKFNCKSLIVSDWDAVKNPLISLNSGLDLEMPFNQEHYEQMCKHLENGLINIFNLNQAVERILDLLYLNEDQKKFRKINISHDERRSIAQEINNEGIVLLKNNSVLPLKQKSKAVILGSPANRYFYGGGSSEVTLKKPYFKLYQALNELNIETINDDNIINVGLTTSTERFDLSSLDIISSDYIIITCGEDNLTVCESRNRETIKLSSTYEKLIKELKKYNKPIIVCLYASGSIDVTNFIDVCDALIFVGYGGETVNSSLSKILTGNVCPSGKLMETFPIKLNDCLSMNSYSDSLIDIYQEKKLVGYRHFITNNVSPMFEFGFGLSYTTFKYSNFNINVLNNYVNISFDITNTGSYDGKEISQIYVGKSQQLSTDPLYELKAFSKDFIAANSKKTINIVLDQDAFTYYDVNSHSYRVVYGDYTIYIGYSSSEIAFMQSITYHK